MKNDRRWCVKSRRLFGRYGSALYQNSGLRNGQGKTLTKERRAWEFAHSCDGYEADTCHTFYIFDKNGEYRKTYLIAIIDNHSRMIVGAEFFSMIMQSTFKKCGMMLF